MLINETKPKMNMKTITTPVLAIALLGFLPIHAGESKTAAEPKSAAAAAKKSDTAPAAVSEMTAPKVSLTPSQEDKLLILLNKGSKDELYAINGIAATRADSIISARPFKKVHEIILVPGVGNATFERIIEHGKTLAQTGAKSGKP